jgi:uncharacterized protein involved in exopolysaccharide biosynthesis
MASPTLEGLPAASPQGQVDGLELVRVAKTVWQGRLLIVCTAAFFGLVGLVYGILATPIYRSEVLLVPNRTERRTNVPAQIGGLASLVGLQVGDRVDENQSIATLRSRAFAEAFIKDENLLPVLFADEWDEASGKWEDPDPEEWPDLRDGVKLFTEDVRFVAEDIRGLVTLRIEWPDAELAAKWAEELVRRVNEQIRTRDLEDSQLRLDYLNAELENTSLVELRQAISRLVESEIQKVTLAKAQAEYAFKIIDPPRVPNRHERPRRVLIVILAMCFGAVVGAFAALLGWRWPFPR